MALVSMLIATLFAVVSLVVRWARSEGMERQQLKLMTAVFVVFALATALEFGGGQGLPVVEVIFTIATLLIPTSVAVTISAYRLYDIDRLISRSISYAIVVALLALVFSTPVILLPNWIPGVADSPLLVAIGTLAAAALFNPPRRRVQIWVDRRFNRSRYDTERVLDQFASGLRDRIGVRGIDRRLGRRSRGDDAAVVGRRLDEIVRPAGLGAGIRNAPVPPVWHNSK